MLIPRFWAKARTNVSSQIGGRRGDFQLTGWGWSDRDEAEAAERAKENVARIGERVRQGQRFPDHYGYGANRPLREQIVREIAEDSGEPSAVITRNSYGCLVLNTARVMFVDIDLPVPAQPSLGIVESILSLFTGRKQPVPAQSHGSETAALDRVKEWLRDRNDYGLRAYRTAAGLRLLVTSAFHDPASTDTRAVLEALDCDPMYVKLCQTQQSFRARLTPKPWRCRAHNPGVSYPFENAGAQRRFEQWLATYESKTPAYATCAFVAEMGRARCLPEMEPLVELHDELTGAKSGRPLA